MTSLAFLLILGFTHVFYLCFLGLAVKQAERRVHTAYHNAFAKAFPETKTDTKEPTS